MGEMIYRVLTMPGFRFGFLAWFVVHAITKHPTSLQMALWWMVGGVALQELLFSNSGHKGEL